MPHPPRYALTGALRWHDFGDGWVAYSTATGALRHLDATDAALLSLLEEGPATADALCQALTLHTGAQLPDDMRAGLAALLGELAEAGFLWPLAADA